MHSKFWIILYSAWAAGAVLADTPPTKLFLGDVAYASGDSSSDFILWQPTVDGLTRYQLNLPKSGIANALKYKDTAALFYMSQHSDLGIDLIHQDKGQFHASYSTDTFRALYKSAVSPKLSYHLGFERNEENISPLLGGSWRTVTGHTRLDQAIATLSKSGASLSWTRTKLKNDDQSESFYTLLSEAGEFKASFGTRWFDFFQGIDLIAEAGLSEGSFILGAQLEQGIGSADAHLGAKRNLSSGKTDFILGLRYKFGDHTKLTATTQNGLSASKAPTLKPLRRAALSRQWRDKVLLKKKTLQR